MAHFAKVVNGIVEQVIVISNEDAPTEAAGQAFIASIGLEGEWLQTSYNAATNGFRGNYAGIGDMYDATLDEFISPALIEE
jgi:hypothetical protein